MVKKHDHDKFEKMIEPIVHWLAENYDPFYTVIITSRGGKLAQDEFAIPFMIEEEEI